jgi:hypothetical protein
VHSPCNNHKTTPDPSELEPLARYSGNGTNIAPDFGGILLKIEIL